MPPRPDEGSRPADARPWPIPWWAIEDLAGAGWFDLEELDDIPEPRWRTPTVEDLAPVDRPDGIVFDVTRVDRVLRALAGLRHTKGKWARTPLRLDAWQIVYVVAPAFGWVDVAEGARVVREAWIEIPRKNGKSTMASGLGIVLLVADGEAGAEVYAAATSRGQAGVIFDEAKRMLTTAPALAGKTQGLTDVIRVPGTGGIFRALSRIADAAHGLNVSGATVDEVHVHKSRDLIDAIVTGTPARAQPLVVFLTTADDGDETTIYAERHGDVVALAEGHVAPDLTTYGVIFAADEGADPFARETWATANPGLGVSVAEDYLVAQAEKARRLPSYLATFERLHLNLRRTSRGAWIGLGRWDDGGGIIDEEYLRGRRAFAGLDLGATDDFTAWVLLFPDTLVWHDDDRTLEVDGFHVLPRIWVPETALEKRERMAPKIRAWEREGFLTITEGDATDYHGSVKPQIFRDAETFDLVEFAFDPWQSESLRQELMDGGVEGWKCSQRLTHLAHPTRRFEELVMSRALNHGGHPVLRWMLSNTVLLRDGDGNAKPDKRKSAEKIDGVVAAVMALAAALRDRAEEPPSEGFALMMGGDD